MLEQESKQELNILGSGERNENNDLALVRHGDDGALDGIIVGIEGRKQQML